MIEKEDYKEECCPLKKPSKITYVPMDRVLSKLDEYLNKEDYEAAKKHLDYWEQEALMGFDEKAQLTILNEKVGLYRKNEEFEASIGFGKEALALAKKLGLTDGVSMGTTMLNLATAYKASGNDAEAIQFYDQAQKIYEECLKPTDYRMAGLNNNSGLCLMDLGRCEEAKERFFKAIEILEAGKDNECDIAITYCNLAENEEVMNGLEEGEKEIDRYLGLAKKYLLSESTKRTSYFAYACEKCANAFGYYGYFLDEKELYKLAEEVRERS